jgi:hypothetical protein
MPILTIDTRTRSSILLSNINYRLNQLTRVYVFMMFTSLRAHGER